MIHNSEVKLHLNPLTGNICTATVKIQTCMHAHTHTQTNVQIKSDFKWTEKKLKEQKNTPTKNAVIFKLTPLHLTMKLLTCTDLFSLFNLAISCIIFLSLLHSFTPTKVKMQKQKQNLQHLYMCVHTSTYTQTQKATDLKHYKNFHRQFRNNLQKHSSVVLVMLTSNWTGQKCFPKLPERC